MANPPYGPPMVPGNPSLLERLHGLGDGLLNGLTPEQLATFDELYAGPAPQLDQTQETLAPQTGGQQFVQGFAGLENQPQGPARGFGQGLVQGLSRGLGAAGSRIEAQRAKLEAGVEQRSKERAAANQRATDLYNANKAGGRRAYLMAKIQADLAAGKKSTPAEIRAEAQARAEGTAAGTPGAEEKIMSPAAIQKRVEIYAAGGAEPSFGYGKAGVANRVAFNDALGKLPGTGADIQAGRATYGAEKTNLTNLTKTQGAAKAFGETAERNLSQVEQALKKLPDLGASFLNAPMRAAMGAMGSKDIAAWRTAMVPVRNEFTRLLNSPTAAGVITNDMRDEISKILDENATRGQIRTSIKILRQDFRNRIGAYDADIAATKARLSQIGTPPAGSAESRARPPLQSFERP